MARKKVTNNFKVFPERLSALMKERQTTQQALASVLGVKRQTISLYKSGQSMPDAEQLKNIAKFFDVSADWLLGLTKIKSRDFGIQQICDKTGLSEQAINNITDIKHQKSRRDFVLSMPEVLNKILESEWFGTIIYTVAAAIGKGATNYIEQLPDEERIEIENYLLKIESALKGSFQDDFYISVGYETKDHYINTAKTYLGHLIEDIHHEYEASIDKPISARNLAESKFLIKKGLLTEKELLESLAGSKPMQYKVIVKDE